MLDQHGDKNSVNDYPPLTKWATEVFDNESREPKSGQRPT